MATFADSPGQSNRIAPSYVATRVSRVTVTGGECRPGISQEDDSWQKGRTSAVWLRLSDDLMAFGRWKRRPEVTLTGMADEEEGSAGLSRELALFKVAHLI